MIRASDHNVGFVFNIKFSDANGAIIDTYNPQSYGVNNETLRRLGENEELIGFYGIDNGKDFYFNQFGFIVKVPME